MAPDYFSEYSKPVAAARLATTNAAFVLTPTQVVSVMISSSS